MTPKEKDILRATKRFASVNRIYYDKMTENMILNAMREVEKVQAQQLKEFMGIAWTAYRTMLRQR